MISQIFKTILAGILAGLALFVLPFFFIRILIFFLLLGAIFRLLGGRRRGMYGYACGRNLHNMSEEERAAFMQKFRDRCGFESRKPSETKEEPTK